MCFDIHNITLPDLVRYLVYRYWTKWPFSKSSSLVILVCNEETLQQTQLYGELNVIKQNILE
jgi:hypothetical protein